MKNIKKAKWAIIFMAMCMAAGLINNARAELVVQQLTSSDTNSINPKVSGKNAVWQSQDPNGHWQIQLYEGNSIIALTDSNSDNINPAIFRTSVVWQGWDPNGKNWEIFYFDGDKITQLTHNDFNDIDPQISKTLIVWQGQDGNNLEIFSAKIPQTVKVEMKVTPQTLNLKSKGQWLICHLELPKGYENNDVEVSSLRLLGTVPVKRVLKDEESDEMLLQFSLKNVEALLSPGDKVKITLTGELKDGTLITASDTIKVIKPGGKK